MANTRFKGETAAERLDFSGISDSDMIQLRHKPGTIDDADKGISKANLLSCPFGVSDTAAGTVAKTASLTDSNPDFSLVSGREVVVCFSTANSASSPTLNFAGSGAYPIYYPDGSAVGAWAAGTWMHLKYFSATVGGNAIQRWILLSPLPVDTVALNNMQSVTSNAVYNETKKITVINGSTLVGNGTYTLKKVGRLVTLDIQGMIIPTTQGDFIAMVLPAEFLPTENITVIGCYGGGSYNYDNLVCFGIQTNGNILSYPYQNFTTGIQQLHACWVTSN